MKKIVINTCFGGFNLSDKATERYLELKGIAFKRVKSKYSFGGDEFYIADTAEEKDKYFSNMDIPRDDETLIKVIEEMGDKADGDYAELSIVEIPDDIEWQIEEYDGNEHIAEQHMTWR